MALIKYFIANTLAYGLQLMLNPCKMIYCMQCSWQCIFALYMCMHAVPWQCMFTLSMCIREVHWQYMFALSMCIREVHWQYMFALSMSICVVRSSACLLSLYVYTCTALAVHIRHPYVHTTVSAWNCTASLIQYGSCHTPFVVVVLFLIWNILTLGRDIQYFESNGKEASLAEHFPASYY